MKIQSFLLFFICCFAEAMDCNVFGQHIVDRAFKQVSIDREAMQQWVSSQPPKYQRFAQLVADNILLVDQQRFEKALKGGMEKILESIPEEDKIVMVYPGNLGSSALWTSRYAQALIPRLQEVSIVSQEELLGSVLSRMEKGGKVHVIALDDAAYSGQQLERDVYKFTQFLGPLLRQKDFRKRLSLKFFRTFGSEKTTERARRALVDYEFLAPEVSFHYGFLRKPIDKYFNISLEEKSDFANFSSDLMMDPESEILTLPFHKLPDDFSFPYGVRKGYTGNASQARPFIRGPAPKMEEPYRQPAYLDFFKANKMEDEPIEGFE